MKAILESVKDWLQQYPILYDNIKYLGVAALAYISYFITRKVFFRIIQNLTRKTKTSIDDVIFNNKIIRYISLIVPLYIIQRFAYLEESLKGFIIISTNALIILFVLLAIGNLITSVTEHLEKNEKFARQPIKGYAQVAKIILYVYGALFIIGIFTGEKPWVILTGIGALSAVLLLVFKDTLLGFVASIQISSYELIKIGDWIEMPSFGADGEVVDIALHSIRIQNWDKTYTLIPTYKLVENSFKNWKGMEQSGSRRIKRHLNIDINSIRFMDAQLIKAILESDHISSEIKDSIKNSESLGSRDITNLGLFIQYTNLYILNRPDIRKDLISVVRTQQSTSDGLPIEIYAFCSYTDLIEYERTQKEIFEHIFAILPLFGLAVFQHPGGNDFKNGFKIQN